MKKLLYLFLFLMFITSEMMAGSVTIQEASGRTGAQIATDISLNNDL